MKRVFRPARAAKVAVLVALVAITATGCDVPSGLYFGWPEGITEDAHQMRTFWTWVVIAALAVGAIVWGLTLWTVVFHSKKRADKRADRSSGPAGADNGGASAATDTATGTTGAEKYASEQLTPSENAAAALPRQFQYNKGLEFFCVIVPVVMVLVLFFFTVTTGQKVTAKEADPDMRVDVTAFQWNWEFGYPGTKTSDGEDVSTVGTTNRIPLLVVPTNRKVEYKLRSTDVIHSFWVVDFDMKRDVLPYPRKNNQEDTYQTTVEEPGAFVGRCAELCGTYHSAMNFELRALPPKLFDRYMELRTETDPATGESYTAAGALGRMQDEGCDGDLCAPEAVTTHPFATDRTGDSSFG